MGRGLRVGSSKEESEASEAAPGSKSIVPFASREIIDAHSKLISGIDFNFRGTRMVTGSFDSSVKIWDFHVLRNNRGPLKIINPASDNHMIQDLRYSHLASHFLCAGGDNTCRVFDGDGNQIQMTVTGDMYVRDASHTKGHTHTVTSCQYHPYSENLFMTSSVDCTVRVWDIHAKPYGIDQAIPHLHCLKAVDKRNLTMSKCQVTAADWCMDSMKYIIGGCGDGSLQVWDEKKRYNRPDKVIRSAHMGEVSSVLVTVEGRAIFTRGEDDFMKRWDIRKFEEPVKVWTDMNVLKCRPKMKVIGEHEYMITGSAGTQHDPTGHMKMFNLSNDEMTMCEAFPTTVSHVAFNEEIHQLFVGLSSGDLHVFHDNSSTKGVIGIMTVEMMSRKQVEIGYNEPVFSMADLPDGYKETRSGHIKRVRPMLEVKDPLSMPDDVAKQLGDALEAKRPKNIKDEDSAEMLRQFAAVDDDALLTGDAYKATQPKVILDYSMKEFEEEELLNQRAKCPRCGLKMCHCGYMTANPTARGRKLGGSTSDM